MGSLADYLVPVVGLKGLVFGRSIFALNAFITIKLRHDLFRRCVGRGAVGLGTIDGMIKKDLDN